MNQYLRQWSALKLHHPFQNPRLIHVINTLSGTGAIFVTNDDDVFTIGYRWLGSRHWGNENQTRKVEELCKKKIKSFAYYLDRFAALSEDGKMFIWGQRFINGEFRPVEYQDPQGRRCWSEILYHSDGN